MSRGPKRWFWRGLVLLAVAATGWAAWRSASEAAVVWDTYRGATGARTSSEGEVVDDNPLRISSGPLAGDTVRLDTVSRGVVFVFDPACTVCRRTVSPWTDVATCEGDGRPERALYALYLLRGRDPEPRLPPLDGAAALAGIDPKVAVDSFGLTSTPSTALVEEGRYVKVYEGLLNDRQKREVQRHAGC